MEAAFLAVLPNIFRPTDLIDGIKNSFTLNMFSYMGAVLAMKDWLKIFPFVGVQTSHFPQSREETLFVYYLKHFYLE